jgi:CBS domain-containing protein
LLFYRQAQTLLGQRSETMNEVRGLDMKVHDVMTSIVKCCGPEIDLSTAILVMCETDCGALPVIDEAGRVIGMITDRDIAIAAASKGRPTSDIVVSEVISRQVYGVSRDEDIKSALKTMRQEKARRLPVVDDDGILQGILSLNDIVICAEDARGKQVPDITYEDVVSTYRAICEHRPLKVAVSV